MFIFRVVIRAPVIQPLSQSENEQNNLNNRGGHSVADARHLCGSCNFAKAK
jgi:hypothetical protein